MNWTEAKHRIHERLISSEQSNKYNLLVKVGVAADVYRTWYLEKPGHMIAVTYPMLQQWTVQDDISIPDLEAAAAHNDGESYFVRKMSEILGFADGSTSQMYVVSKADGMFCIKDEGNGSVFRCPYDRVCRGDGGSLAHHSSGESVIRSGGEVCAGSGNRAAYDDGAYRLSVGICA